MIRFLSIGCIKLYQKFISPKKGFGCAYRIKHGGTGCSGAIIKIIEENSILDWRKLIKKRFNDCKLAAEEIKKDGSKKCKKCKECKAGDACDFGCDVFDACDGCDFF